MSHHTCSPTDEGMVSHRGHVRPLNEDSYGSFRTVLNTPARPDDLDLLRRKGRLYIVTDGMGGHDSGDVASATAVQTICAAFYADPSTNPAESLRRAIEQANGAIYATARARRQPGSRPMGTTVVCAVIHESQLTVAHVGDSRAYLLRDGVLRRLTSDHDWLTEQMRAHGVSHEEAMRTAHERKAVGVLMRAVGVQPQVQPDIASVEWRSGDTLLLCSDGLHGLVGDSDLQQILAAHPAPLAARELIAAANRAGGHDNVTALVVRAGGEAPRLASPRFSRRSAAAVSLAAAAVLLVMGLTVPAVSGQPLIRPEGMLEIAGMATLQPTATLKPEPSATPTVPATAPPTATMPPATRAPQQATIYQPTPSTRQRATPRPQGQKPTEPPAPSAEPQIAASATLATAQQPSAMPPTEQPTEPPAPTFAPAATIATAVPTSAPRAQPRPTKKPVSDATPAPTAAPTQEPPTAAPVEQPTTPPTTAPTQEPPAQEPPTAAPTQEPPTAAPVEQPTTSPTAVPTHEPPTAAPAQTSLPLPIPAPTIGPVANSPTAAPRSTLAPTQAVAPEPTHAEIVRSDSTSR